MLDMFSNVGIYHYLALSVILMLVGLLGILISRNMTRILMSVFVVMLALVINFVTWGFYCDSNYEKTNMITFFVLFIFALQFVLALLVLCKIFQRDEYLDVEKMDDK